MAKITVSRESGYSNKLRKIKLVLDNQVISEIEDGEVKVISVNSGKYKLKAKIDWCQSNVIELDIKEGENKEVTLKGTNPLLALYYITFGRKKYLKLEM